MANGISIINSILLLIFIVSATGNILGHGLNKKRWIYFTKPLLMPLLLIYYILNSPYVHFILVFALFFAFLGDIFLLKPENKLFFMLGLLAFLFMQLLYILFISSEQITFSEFHTQHLFYTFIFLFLGFAIYITLLPHLKEMKLPVLVYMLVIITVSYFCFVYMMQKLHYPGVMQFAGSLLFLISDTILAFDSFHKPIRLSGVWIMATYIAAQLFLFIGFLNT